MTTLKNAAVKDAMATEAFKTKQKPVKYVKHGPANPHTDIEILHNGNQNQA